MFRHTLAVHVLFITIPAAFAVDLIDEPYSVFIVEDSYARCGPSDEYYRTDRLEAGSTVEVYVETKDGWLGIRPPQTSFCWLPADQVELHDNGDEGTIVDPEAVAWIGTNLGKAQKYRWQVKFQPGETVAIIGSVDRQTATGETETWYRIVPPPGEFRWVHDSQAVRDKEQLARAQLERRTAQLAATSADSGNRQSEPANGDVIERPDPFDARRASDSALPLRNTDRPVDDVRNITQAGFQSEIPTRPITSEMQVADQIRVRNIASTTSANGSRGSESPWFQSDRSGYAPRQFDPVPMPRAELEGLQIEFGRLIADQGNFKQLEALRLRVLDVSNDTANTAERGSALALAARISNYQELTTDRTPVAASDPQPTSPASIEKTGWLQQVYSTRPDAPPFALTDPQGKTIAYVSPAIGMNIRRYLNKEVKVVGRPSTRADLQELHFIAEGIVPMRR